MQQDLDLAATYARWDTEDLVRAATTEASELTPEALTAMRQELERPRPAARSAGTSPAATGEDAQPRRRQDLFRHGEG
jgi:vacuolar-type H+-ATPase subunit H